MSHIGLLVMEALQVGEAIKQKIDRGHYGYYGHFGYSGHRYYTSPKTHSGQRCSACYCPDVSNSPPLTYVQGSIIPIPEVWARGTPGDVEA